ARRVVAVVAQVRHDEGERRSRAGAGQVARQRPERQDVRGAEGLAGGDRGEEGEPVVAGGVLVAPLGLLGVVDGPGGGVAAGGPARRRDRVIPARVVAHVLQVRGPAAPGGGQLTAERRDRRRVDAALAEDLAVRPGDDLAGERYPERAVELGGQGRGLPGDLRDVVGRAAVADGVVVLQQGPRPRQRGGQVRIGGRGAEALLVSLVLQLDHPHVPDRRQPPLAAGRRGA